MYGTAKEDCKNDTVLVVEPQGLRQLHGRMDLEILSFYLCVPEAERERRMLIEGRPIEHIKSRIKNDRDIFDDISYEVDYILYDNTLEEAVTNILREVDLD
jgi:guanylate kinase